MLTVNTHGFATGDDFHSGIPLKTEDKSENRCDVVVTVARIVALSTPSVITGRPIVCSVY